MKRLLQIANWLSKLIGIRWDYILHFGVCSLSTYLIGIISFLIVNILLGFIPALIASLFGVIFSMGLSIGKESGDKNNPNSGWSWNDLIADALGILVGLIILTITILIIT